MALIRKLLTLRNSNFTSRIALGSQQYRPFLQLKEDKIGKPTKGLPDEMETVDGVDVPMSSLNANEPKKQKILSPPMRTGMKTLDRTVFIKEIKVPSLLLVEEDFRNMLKPLKPFLLKIKGIKPTFPDPENGTTKRILLNPDTVPDLPSLLRKLPEIKVSENIINSTSLHPLRLTYDHWTFEQLIDSVLPGEEGQGKFSSFTRAGHLIHVNLKDNLLPYRNIIGQILLDKIANIKTVVNKTKNIENEFRNFPMEVIAGEPHTVVKVKENHCEYEFDFATVYWNSRLSSEHENIIQNYVKKGGILFDVFAGIGPFAIPAAKRKCFVLANDLNPESTRWLKHNVIRNKVSGYVQVFNKDGRNFIREDVSTYLKAKFAKKDSELPQPHIYHVVMNLPAIAVEFLDAFWNLLDGEDVKLPADLKLIVHVYCFIKDTEGYNEKALALVKEKLNFDLPQEAVLEVAFVRNVAPNKEMLRVSFVMPHHILKNTLTVVSGDGKRKLSDLEGS